MLVTEYGDFDIVVNDNGFVLIPCEYEHHASPSVVHEHYARKVEVRVSETSQVSCKTGLTNDAWVL